MVDRYFLYRVRTATQGGFIAVAPEVQMTSTYTGLLSGTANVDVAFARVDGTGLGAPIFRFTGSYSATADNIDEWFGGRQLIRLRCTDSDIPVGSSGVVAFNLPGTTALNTAFDQLATAGLEEIITFIIEYTGPGKDQFTIRPRGAPAPQIGGTSSILVRPQTAAEIEITRDNNVISAYIFRSIGSIGGAGGVSADSLKLINPLTAVWDASANGTLPTSVVKGNAYRVVRAPSDGSGRFEEPMQNDDWVYWFGETFTSWEATPRQWAVIAAHDVRRISALESNFLNTVQLVPVSDRNTIIRGADYATDHAEIRFQIYANRADYDPTDLNQNGQIDEYTAAAPITGYLAVRLPGSETALATELPTIYAYLQADGQAAFTRLVNLRDGFVHQGDFGTEQDYLSNETVTLSTGDVIRLYSVQLIERYDSPDLDVNEPNLSDAVQAKLNRTDPGGTSDNARLTTLENQIAALYPLRSYVTDLESWGDIYNPELSTGGVSIASGYSLIADYRGDGTRYESPGVTYSSTETGVVTYTGLGDHLFRTFGLRVSGPADQVLLWYNDGTERIPLIDMTAAGNYRVNHFTPATTADERVTNQPHSINLIQGTNPLTPGTSAVALFTATPFPTGAANEVRTAQLGLRVFVGGVDSGSGHISEITLPADASDQAEQTFTANIQLGPTHNHRVVTVEMAYSTTDMIGDLHVMLRLLSAPTDVTIQIRNVIVFLSYDVMTTTSRVDNFVAINDRNGTYTFTGENELLISSAPYDSRGVIDVVPVAVDSDGNIDELNDESVPIPQGHFASVTVPAQSALSGFQFRTFAPDHEMRHSELATLLGRRATEWCYGLALARSAGIHAVTETLEFTQSIVLLGNTNNTRVRLTVNDADTDNITLVLTEV